MVPFGCEWVGCVRGLFVCLIVPRLHTAVQVKEWVASINSTIVKEVREISEVSGPVRTAVQVQRAFDSCFLRGCGDCRAELQVHVVCLDCPKQWSRHGRR